MKFKLLIFFFLLSILFNAQYFSGNFSLKPESYSSNFFEKSNTNFYYELSFISNPKVKENIKKVTCVLQIGDKYSKFGELNAIKYDSLMQDYSHMQSIGAKEFNTIYPFVKKWKTILLRELIENKLTIQDQVKDTYQYTEQQPNFNWELYDEKKEILGYTCYKAITDFRGRKYVAWYSKEIPLNNGPYLFNGLPGLIMEIEDSKSHYHFTIIGIDKKEMDIYLRKESKIFVVERDKFRVIQKSYYDNPSFFMNKTYDVNGNVINDKKKSLPYNPIELQ